MSIITHRSLHHTQLYSWATIGQVFSKYQDIKMYLAKLGSGPELSPNVMVGETTTSIAPKPRHKIPN